MQAVQKITSVPCGAVSSDRSQMGPLLYGRLSFSAENSPSLLNVFKNLLQILQVASCETEKVHHQSWFCVLVCVCQVPTPPPLSFLSFFFSALPPPLSIFDSLGYPAAKSADLAGLAVPVRATHSAAASTEHRGAGKAIRWVEARRPGCGGNAEHPRQLGWIARPNSPSGAGLRWGERGLNPRRKQRAPALGWRFSPVFRSAAPSTQSGQFRAAAPSLRRGWGCVRGLRSGIGKWGEGEPREPAGPSPVQDGEKRDGESPPGCGLSREATLGHLPGERGRSETRLSMQETSVHL